MSCYIKTIWKKKYYCLDDFFWSHQYWYVEMNEEEMKSKDSWWALFWPWIDKNRVMTSEEFQKVCEAQENKNLTRKRLLKLRIQDKAKISTLEKNLEKEKWEAFRQWEMREHFESLHEAWVWELHFEKVQWEFLLDLIREIQEYSEWRDELVCAIIENWLNKYNLNKLKHAKEIFS